MCHDRGAQPLRHPHVQSPQPDTNEHEARAKATLGSIGEAVVSVGPTGLVEFINPAAECLFCREAGSCVKHELTAIVSIAREWDRRPVDPIEQVLRGTEPWTRAPISC